MMKILIPHILTKIPSWEAVPISVWGGGGRTASSGLTNKNFSRSTAQLQSHVDSGDPTQTNVHTDDDLICAEKTQLDSKSAPWWWGGGGFPPLNPTLTESRMTNLVYL